MSYTSVTEESIFELRDWNPSKEYIVIASMRKLKGAYTIFEPCNSFTKYKEAKLLSRSKSRQQVWYLYQVFLPCAFNPFLYFIFDDVELSALELTGNSETDGTVYVRKKSETLENEVSDSDFLQLVNDESRQLSYESTETGEFKIDGELESVFCEGRIDELENQRYKPYFYSSVLPSIRLVFKNESSELQLLKSCCEYCESSRPQQVIGNYRDSLVNGFLRLFDTKGTLVDVEHQIRVMYKSFLSNLTLKETIIFVGDLLRSIQAQNSSEADIVISTHYLILGDDSLEKCFVRTVDTERKAIITVEFHPQYYSIWNSKGERKNVPYDNIEFTYGHLLLP